MRQLYTKFILSVVFGMLALLVQAQEPLQETFLPDGSSSGITGYMGPTSAYTGNNVSYSRYSQCGTEFTWSFISNTSGASFVGNDSTGVAVTVDPGNSPGSFTLRLTLECGAYSDIYVDVLADPGIPTNNPTFNGECPNDILLVLDESGSIVNDGYEDDVELAVTSFLEAISGTGARVAIIEFSDYASVFDDGNFVEVTESNINTHFTPYLNDASSGYGAQQNDGDGDGGAALGGFCTNWEDALRLANNYTSTADIVLFFTDGNPTLYNVSGIPPSGTIGGNCNDAAARNVQDAIFEANNIKSSTKLFTIGVGQTNQLNITRITGGSSLDNTTFDNADYVITSNFAQLASTFADVAEELCGTELSINKSLVSGGEVCVGSPTSFSIAVQNIGNDNNAGDVVVTDTFPTGYSNIGYSGAENVVISNNIVTWTVGQLTPNQSKTITLTADIISTAAGNLTNTATATSSNADPVTSTVQGSSINAISMSIDDIEFHSLTSSYSDLTIADGNTYDLAALGIFNIEAEISGSDQSAKFIIYDSGYTNIGSRTENNEPYRYNGDNTAFDFGAGTYHIAVFAYSIIMVVA